MKTLTIIFLHLIFIIHINAQVTQQWVTRYNGPGNANDRGWSLAEDNSGNVYVCGFSTGSSGKFDFALVKYSPEGSELWARRYSSAVTGDDVATYIVVDNSSSCLYITGISEIPGGTENVLIKYDLSGVQQWVKTYPGPLSVIEANNTLALDAEGNVYMAGGTRTSTGTDFLIVKYKYSGDELWSLVYDGPGFSLDDFDVAQSVAVDSEGNVCATGISDGSGTFDDYVTIKYSSSGSELWVNRYNGTGGSFDDVASLLVDNNNNIYITGGSVQGSDYDCVTIKYNSAGVQQWIRSYNGTGNGSDGGVSIARDVNGGIYVTGAATGSVSSGDYLTIKYNSDGVQEWVQLYNGPGNSWDNTASVKVTPGGDVFVTGVSWGGATKHDYATIKYNSAGVQQWIQRYSGTAGQNDYAYAMITVSDYLLVTGWSINSGVNEDYTTIKYSMLTGIGQVFGETPSEFSLGQNYPNPFNPVTSINFTLPKHAAIKLIVYDMLGKQLETLVDEELAAGKYNVNWNAAKYSSGAYFYTIRAGEYTETKKMFLVK
jgi:uncharacterized delta-60 repeat protein